MYAIDYKKSRISTKIHAGTEGRTRSKDLSWACHLALSIDFIHISVIQDQAAVSHARLLPLQTEQLHTSSSSRSPACRKLTWQWEGHRTQDDLDRDEGWVRDECEVCLLGFRKGVELVC